MQVPPGGTPVPATQLLPTVKKSESPVIIRLLTCKVALPVLVTVTVWLGAAALMICPPKFRLAGLTLIAGFTPVPVTKAATTGGELLLEIVRKPLRVPIANG